MLLPVDVYEMVYSNTIDRFPQMQRLDLAIRLITLNEVSTLLQER
jgi:hypothetical protein